MKEIGSFIELEFPNGREYYRNKAVRLNSGRAAIYHAFRCTHTERVYLPYYQCGTVAEFLNRKNTKVEFYRIDSNFEPILPVNAKNTSVVIVNYFGIMGQARMKRIAEKYNNVIIDNSQAFFAEPIDGCFNVYSARKFVGAPDGAYVIGDGAEEYYNEYEQGYSSDTALFLLQRIEYGCEGKTYENRSKNEERIDGENIKKMSALTKTILDGADYDLIKTKRRRNFNYARILLDSMNKINVGNYIDDNIVPMVYPLLVEDDGLLSRMLDKKHFQGHWWSYLCGIMPNDSFENYVSKYMIPITIDQRYDENDIDYIYSIIKGV